jgi:beta-glucosidase
MRRRQFLASAGALAAASLAESARAQAPSASFPPGFVWGAATSSYQIEGSPVHAGGGPSVWDAFCKRPGAIRDGSSGDVAADHVRRFQEDVQHMRELGLRAYRLSFSWPRIFPEGVGRVNEQGAAFYDQLIGALLAGGIEPWVTLFHWDYPEALYRRGGWRAPESPDWFAQYAGYAAKRWGDRVTKWMTFNEPEVFVVLGHQLGKHAPGDRLPFADVLRVGHNVLLAHGRAVQAMRAASPRKCEIGYAASLTPALPATDAPADIEAAVRQTFSGMSAWLLEPVYTGAYPEAERREWEKDLPKIGADDMKTIRQPLDFFAANIYHGYKVRAGSEGRAVTVPWPAGHPRTAFDVFMWAPEALHWGPRFYWDRYRLPVVVTENGISVTDWVHVEGGVHDPQRIDFMRRYLRELRRATQAGAQVRGYFAWSLLDNFEWAEGYTQRFGLVFVDFQTQRRVRKDSYAWYREVIRTNGAGV